MAESMNVCAGEWLDPDLRSEDDLRQFLQQRFIKPAHVDLNSLQKEELVELYNRYVLPLPQRKYRNNRRGQEMTRKQILLDKSVKRTSTDDSDQSKLKKNRQDITSNGQVSPLKRPAIPEDRLKPPPSLVNCEKKIVKLIGSGDKSPTSLHPSVQKMDELPEASQDNGPSPAKKRIAKITWP